MRIEEIIGERILQAREGEGWTQAQLGCRLGELLGKTWTRQAVWSAEQGKRVFTAVELVALAYVFGTTVEQLMRPMRETDQITLPGLSIEWSELLAPALPQNRAALREVHADVAHVVDILSELRGAIDGLSSHVEQAIQEARTR